MTSVDIRMVPVRELLRNLTDSCDGYDLWTTGGWLEMLAACAADTQFPALLRALEAEGQKDPIAIMEAYGDQGEPLWEMGNGHHRLTTAILLGWDTVKVVFTSRATPASSGYGREHDSLMEWRQTEDYGAALALGDLVLA